MWYIIHHVIYNILQYTKDNIISNIILEQNIIIQYTIVSTCIIASDVYVFHVWKY